MARPRQNGPPTGIPILVALRLSATSMGRDGPTSSPPLSARVQHPAEPAVIAGLLELLSSGFGLGRFYLGHTAIGGVQPMRVLKVRKQLANWHSGADSEVEEPFGESISACHARRGSGRQPLRISDRLE